MHLRPAAGLSADPAPATPAPAAPLLNEARLRVVIDACRADTPEQRKRLVTALYEGEVLTMAETAALFDRLGLKDA